MFTIVCSFLLLLNTGLLLHSLTALGIYFVVYFLMTQGILSWLLIDSIVARKNQSLPQPVVSLVHKLPPSEKEIYADSFRSQNLNFEIKSNLDFVEPQPQGQTLNMKNRSPLFAFHTLDSNEKSQSQLDLIDHLMQATPSGVKTLVVANLNSHKDNFKNLAGYFAGLCVEWEILCKEISPKKDLIPHLGDLRKLSPIMLKSYFHSKSSQYDKILFYASAMEIEYLQDLLAPAKTTDVAAKQASFSAHL